MEDKKPLLFTVRNNFYLKGSYTGKYETKPKPTNDSFNLSEIILIESNIYNAERCDFDEVIKLEGVTLEINHSEEMNISLLDPEIPEEYVFVEDVKNIKIYNINLENQINEGNKVFGVIKGDIICCLPSEFDIEYIDKSLPPIDSEIIIPEHISFKHKKTVKYFFKIVKYILMFLLFIFLCFLAVKCISEMNLKNPLPSINKTLFQKSIQLEDVKGQKFVKVDINNIQKNFLLDTGASNTLISRNFLNVLISQGFISKSKNFKKRSNYVIADGSLVTGELWVFPSIQVDGVKLYNVEIGVIDSSNITFLLGMSTLKKLGNYKISPNQNKIIIE